MPTSRLPHYVQIAITVATICIMAVLAANSKGDLALPAVVVSILSVIKLAFGMLSESWPTISQNRAMRKAETLPPGYRMFPDEDVQESSEVPMSYRPKEKKSP